MADSNVRYHVNGRDYTRDELRDEFEGEWLNEAVAIGNVDYFDPDDDGL